MKPAVINPNNPPRSWWALRDIFHGCPSRWCDVRVRNLIDAVAQREMTDLYGYLLYACISEQVMFFCAAYDRHFPDDDVQTALRSLCKHGYAPDLIKMDKQAHSLLAVAYNGVMEARGKL